MVDVPSGPVSNLQHDLSSTHIHSSPLCCLQKINLNVFLSIFKSTRLFPIIITYFLLFMFSEEQKPGLLCGPDGLQSPSETTDALICNPPASASQALTTGSSHHMWLTFTYIFVYFLSFFLLYILPFIFISSVFATSLLIKHNFPHSNKNKPEPKYS